jgi:hypothetical protein
LECPWVWVLGLTAALLSDKFVHYKTTDLVEIDNPPRINGSLTVKSTSDDFSCAPLRDLGERINGELVCSGGDAVKIIPMAAIMSVAVGMSLLYVL